MRPIGVLLAFVAFATMTFLSPLQSRVLAQSLPTDPRLVTGQLPNGFKYVILQHANPPGRAAAYLHIDTGSLNETDKQRGIAHYLEHMAFNGSEHFKPGDVMPFFQSLGLTFGRHQNAFTSFDQTTYQLELPDNKTETFEKGMLFFSDVAFRLSLLQSEVDKERQIILEEKRTRLGAQQRMSEYILARLAPGSTLGERIPIGTEETLMAVQQPDFQEYYSKWYTASNMTLIVVADMDPAAVTEAIAKHFSDGPKKDRPERLPTNVKPQTETRAIVASDDELARATVMITKIEPAKPPVTTVRGFRDELAERLAFVAFNRRVGKKADQGKLKLMQADAGASTLARTIRQVQARATGKPSEWKVMLQDLALEIRRASAHGFEAWEVADAGKELLATYKQNAARDATQQASLIIRQLNGRIASEEPLMSAQQRLELAEQLIPTIDPREVNWIFAAAFDGPGLTFIAQLPKSILDGPPTPTEAELAVTGAQAMSVTPAAEAMARGDKPLLEKIPTPGVITEKTAHEASGVTSVWLSNGVRMHHRFMDYFKNEARITVSLAGGELLEDDGNRGITQAASLAWTTAATKRLSSSDITDLLAGARISVSGTAGKDQMSLTVRGNPEDLDLGMQLVNALLTEPKVEQPPLDKWKTAMLQAISGNNLDPQGRFGLLLADTVYPKGDARPRFPTAQHVNRLTLEAVQAWLDARIKDSPIEVSVVGDLPLDKALELVTTYVGSLPSRDRVGKETYAKLRNIPKPTGPRDGRLEFPTQSAKSMVMSGFGGPDAGDLADVRALQMAARVLSTRMKTQVREDEQLVYSIGASVTPEEVYPGYGVFFASAPTDPQKVERLVKKLDEVYDAFAKEGPTEEEIGVAKKQQANMLDENMKTPTYWGAQIQSLTFRGRNLDDILSGPSEYEKLTAAQIKEVFNKYYKPESRIRAVLQTVPASGETPPPPPAAKP